MRRPQLFKIELRQRAAATGRSAPVCSCLEKSKTFDRSSQDRNSAGTVTLTLSVQ